MFLSDLPLMAAAIGAAALVLLIELTVRSPRRVARAFRTLGNRLKKPRPPAD